MIERYFSFNGELKRLEYFQMSVRLNILLLFMLGIAVTALMEFGWLAIPLVALTFFVWLAGNLSITARRLADLGLARWWCLPIFLLYNLISIGFYNERDYAVFSLLSFFAVIAGFAITLWLLFAKSYDDPLTHLLKHNREAS